MKVSKIISLIVIFLFLTPCQGEIYKWTDSAGKVHFDSNGANALRNDFIIKETLQSIKWEKSKVKFSSSTKKVNKQQVQYNKQIKKQCIKTKKRITKINKQLKTPLIALKFDAFQAELRKLRWTKMKVC